VGVEKSRLRATSDADQRRSSSNRRKVRSPLTLHLSELYYTRTERESYIGATDIDRRLSKNLGFPPPGHGVTRGFNFSIQLIVLCRLLSVTMV
jgi:hypothetical protein